MLVLDAELARLFARNSALMQEIRILSDQITVYIAVTVMSIVLLKQSSICNRDSSNSLSNAPALVEARVGALAYIHFEI
jgi:hypothetical protein